MPLTQNERIAPQQLYAQQQSAESPIVVDVRLPSEWMALRIGTVVNIPLNDSWALRLSVINRSPSNSMPRSTRRSRTNDGISRERELSRSSWPWYSRVAPVSFLVAHDVREGREHLNFSTWNRLSTTEQARAIHECWEEVEEGEMPLWFYTPLHPEARLSEEDLQLLEAWAASVSPD